MDNRLHVCACALHSALMLSMESSYEAILTRRHFGCVGLQSPTSMVPFTNDDAETFIADTVGIGSRHGCRSHIVNRQRPAKHRQT